MSLRSFFEDKLKNCPSRVMFQFKRDGEVCRRTFAEAGTRAAQIAQLTASIGITARTEPVSIIQENGPVWCETYVAHACTAVPVVPVDPKLRPEEVEYILGDAGVAAIYTDFKHVPLLTKILPALPKVKAVVLIDGASHESPSEIDGRPCYDLESKMSELAAAAAAAESVFATTSVSDDDIASIIYTSGTTGHPKGAIITHGNFCADIEGSVQLIPSVCRDDKFFVVLPLFHAFSFTANLVVSLCFGCELQFATSLRTIIDDMKTFHPTVMMAVPLMVEKFYQKIQDGINSSKMAKFLCAVGLRCFVVHGVRKNFGGNLRMLIVGGAPCSAKLLKAMRSFKMPVIEGYGLTEASPIVSITQIDNVRPGTIGVPLPNVEIRLADKNDQGVGELQVRGPIVMRGYLNRPEASAEAFDGDWLCTGDLASQDADGFLTICGRKKSLIVNREGKNIYPEEVEICIGRDRHVHDICVLGYTDSKDEVGEKVGAIVVPDLDVYKKADGSLPPWEEIEADIRKIVQGQCKLFLAEYKHPRKLLVFKTPLERTSTQKIRRFKYKDALNEV